MAEGGRGGGSGTGQPSLEGIADGVWEPKLDVAVAKALAEYVAKRKAEGGAPMN